MQPSYDTKCVDALRVGLFLGSANLAAWQASVIRSILSLKCATIVVQIETSTGHTKAANSLMGYLTILQRAIQKLDSRAASQGADALQLETAVGLRAAIQRIELRPRLDQSNDSAGAAIASHSLDVLVSFANPALLPHRQRLARFGVWYFEYQGHALSPSDGSQVGLLEVLRRSKHLTSDLRVRPEPGQPDRVAYRTYSAVEPMSHFQTRNQHLWKSSAFVARALVRCHARGGREYLSSLPQADPAPATSTLRLTHGSPGAASWSDLAPYVLWRRDQRARRRSHRERWVLLAGNSRMRPDPRQLRPIYPPADRFWADPHVVEKDGTPYVFFEDASRQTGKAHIAVMRLQNDGCFSAPAPVIVRPYHLSYPFVFHWEGAHYMVPESAENRTIELYRCTRFPDQWQFEHNLMENIKGYDATLLEHQGRWWMFVTIAAHESASNWDELCVFYADSPVSTKWQAHPCNPVISDVRSARPAGPIYLHDGRLLRPSQDSSGRYGRALNINEIVTLTEGEYQERQVERVEPDWDPAFVAVHSFSQAGQLTVMDAVCRESR